MGTRLFGERFVTADFSGSPVVYQAVKFSAETILLACRTQFIFFNDPAFTNIQMRIYNSRSSAPRDLLYTSGTTHTKASILTNTHGFQETYFEFATKPTFKAGDTYYFVPWINGYTGNASTHISWARGYPDPVLRTNLTILPRYLGVFPFHIYFIGSQL